MSAKMTPGPWTDLGRKHMRSRAYETHLIVSKDGVVEAETDDAANARAIGCLPELIEAARAIADFPVTARTLGNLRRVLARIDGNNA